MSGSLPAPAGGGGASEVVRLELPAEPASVALVRHALAPVAVAAGLSDERRDDLSIAVSEACTNVVRHAYPGRAGMLDVSASTSGDALDVIISDDGVGHRNSEQGIGSRLMERLSDLIEIESAPGRGRRVRMSFARD